MQRDSEVKLVNEENPVLWVPQDDLAPQEHLAHKVTKDLRVVVEALESRELLVTLAGPVYPDHPVSPALLDQRVPRVNLVPRVVPAQWVSQVLLVQLESVGCLVYPAHLDLLVSEERLALLENPVWKANVVTKVPSVLLAYLVPLVPSAPLATLDLPARTVNPVLLVFLVVLETRAHKVPLVLRAALDPPVYLDPLVLPDPLDPLESVEIVERLVHRVWRAPLVLAANPERQVHRERKETQEHKVPKVPRDTVVSLVFRVFPELRVLLVTKVYLALLALQARLASPAPRVLLVVTEALVLRVSWVHLVRVVLVVKKVLVVLPVHPVLPDLLVHLVRLWVTITMLCWPYLDRDRPRAQIPFRATTPTFRRVSSAKKSPTMNVANSLQRPMNSSRHRSRSSSNQKARKIPQPRLVATWHTPTQSYPVANTGWIPTRAIAKTPSWCTVTWRRRRLVCCLSLPLPRSSTGAARLEA